MLKLKYLFQQETQRFSNEVVSKTTTVSFVYVRRELNLNLSRGHNDAVKN